MSKKEPKKVEYNPDGTVKEKWWIQAIGVVVVFGLIYLFWSTVFSVGGKGIDAVKSKLNSNSSKKEMCINQTRNIKNEFTAKKLYKQCMKRQSDNMSAIRDLVADILGVSPDAATFIICVPALILAIYLMKK